MILSSALSAMFLTRLERRYKIIEIIDVDNAVAGFLLRELDRRAREEIACCLCRGNGECLLATYSTYA